MIRHYLHVSQSPVSHLHVIPNYNRKEKPNPDANSAPVTSSQATDYGIHVWWPRSALTQASNLKSHCRSSLDACWLGVTQKAAVSLQFCMSRDILVHNSYNLAILCMFP